MRNLKRFLATALTVLMVVSGFAAVSAYTFEDVTDYSEAITILNDLGIILGYSETEFGPDDDVTRWQMALLTSKLMKGDVATETWEGENLTTFEDVTPNHYCGAISYANQMGIVKGTSETTFDPESGITYEQGLTMAVRMLGYGSAEADANYPWAYIDAASKLGLENGLIDMVYTETLTRGETAQLLYNVLLTKTTYGTTYAEKVFGLETATIVITKTTNLNMLDVTSTNVKEGEVAFHILENGELGDAEYVIAASDLGLTGDLNDYVGASYYVVTTDGFKSVNGIHTNANAVLTAADYTVVDANNISIGGTTYNINDGFDVYNVCGSYELKGTGAYVKDSNNNLLDADGNIVIYYVPSQQLAYGYIGFGAYAVRLENGNYIVPTDADYEKVARVDDRTVYAYGLIDNAVTEIGDINAYSDLVVYDDNNDGVWDRAFFKPFSFGIYGVEDTDFDGVDNVVITSCATGAKIDLGESDVVTFAGTTPKKGNYIIYSFNVQSNILTVKETLSTSVGYVSEINPGAGTVKIDGTSYPFGNAKLPGTQTMLDLLTSDADYYTMYVEYVLKDGKVLCFKDYQIENYVVFESFLGFTDDGFITALVYDTNSMLSKISVASIDALPYLSWISMSGIYGTINNASLLDTKGELFEAIVDEEGYYHLKTLTNADYTFIAKEDFHVSIYQNWTSNAIVADSTKVTTGAGVDTTWNRFFADGGTKYIVVKPGATAADTKILSGYGNNAELDIKAGALVKVVYSNPDAIIPTAKYIYISNGGLTSANYSSDEYIVYLDSDSIGSLVNDQSSLGTVLGSVWNYKNVINMSSTSLCNVSALFNYKLERNRFYLVRDGYVVPDYDAQQHIVEGVNIENIGLYTYTVDGVTKDKVTPTLYMAKWDADKGCYDIINKSATDLAPMNFVTDLSVIAAINDPYVDVLAMYCNFNRASSDTFIITDIIGDGVLTAENTAVAAVADAGEAVIDILISVDPEADVTLYGKTLTFKKLGKWTETQYVQIPNIVGYTTLLIPESVAIDADTGVAVTLLPIAYPSEQALFAFEADTDYEVVFELEGVEFTARFHTPV